MRSLLYQSLNGFYKVSLCIWFQIRWHIIAYEALLPSQHGEPRSHPVSSCFTPAPVATMHSNVDNALISLLLSVSQRPSTLQKWKISRTKSEDMHCYWSELKRKKVLVLVNGQTERQRGRTGQPNKSVRRNDLTNSHFPLCKIQQRVLFLLSKSKHILCF